MSINIYRTNKNYKKKKQLNNKSLPEMQRSRLFSHMIIIVVN